MSSSARSLKNLKSTGHNRLVYKSDSERGILSNIRCHNSDARNEMRLFTVRGKIEVTRINFSVGYTSMPSPEYRQPVNE